VKARVIAVGRVRAGWARAALDDYLGRLHRELPTEEIEIRDVPRRKGERPERWRAEEAAGLLAAVDAAHVVVALDERGEDWDSRSFAEWLAARRDEGRRGADFIIGGPDGLDPTVRARADRIWRLGRATLAHELARVVLLEQLYRASTLWAGLPYHRD
jgi:23S rRNA (pseudouridine1915-N3)-methyltransferase